jgi:hypothetical protein
VDEVRDVDGVLGALGDDDAAACGDFGDGAEPALEDFGVDAEGEDLDAADGVVLTPVHGRIGVEPSGGEAVEEGLMGGADGAFGKEFLDEETVFHAVWRRAESGDEFRVTEGGFPHAFGFGAGGGHAGLAEDVLAAGESEIGGVMMEPRRGTDPDDVDVVIVDDIFPAFDGSGFGGVLLTEGAGAFEGGVGDGLDVDAGEGAEIGEVTLAHDITGTDNADAERC